LLDHYSLCATGGIRLQRIKTGKPQQNGRHERMHLTFNKEATRPGAKNLLQQQARFDDFIDSYNQYRPHQALGMQYPAELYVPSARAYRGLEELHYPFQDHTHIVTRFLAWIPRRPASGSLPPAA
jgi:transposase InsO family protein